MNKRFVYLVVLQMLCLALCACKKEAKVQPAPVVEQVVEPVIKQAGPMEPEVLGDVRDITISFVGDFYASDQMQQNYEKSGVLGVVSRKVLDTFRQSDLMVINHEYCATDLDDSYKADFQRWIIRAPQSNEHFLTEMGVDLAMVSNNHMFDYSRQGFEDTLRGLNERGIKYVGAGFDYEDAAEPRILRASNKSVAFLASNDVITRVDWIAEGDKSGMNGLYMWSSTYTEMIERIKEAKRSNDLVVVMLHFGIEKSNAKNDNQTMFAHACIDAGADIIIGSHPHVLQGIEYYNNGLIFYSLGNFLFSNYQSDTMMVTITLKQDNTYTAKILPCSSYMYYTQDVAGEKVYNILNTYSVNAEVDEYGNVRQKQAE